MKYIILTSCFLSFLLGLSVSAAEIDIVINEVLYDAEGTDTGKEFIEIFNQGSEAVDLTGWDLDPSSAPYFTFPDFTLEANNYVIIYINTAGVDNTTELYTGESSNMSNTKGPIALFKSSTHSTENLIAYIAYGAGGQSNESKAVAKGTWEADDFIPDVEPGQSIAYDGSGNSSNDWFIGTPTPGLINTPYTEPPADEPPEEPPPEEPDMEEPPIIQPIIEKPSSGGGSTYKPIFGDIVINEFVSDPTDEEEEWVELYNTTERQIDLVGWNIEEGSEQKTFLNGTIKDKGFLVIEQPRGKLNNAGDIIMLKNSNEEIIDKIVYGNWDDGSLEDNAPKTNDPHSVARKFDGLNTYNNAADLIKTSTPTKGTSNILSDSEDNISSSNFNTNIIINELYPNPPGSDLNNEFIELKNVGMTEVDITGWSITDNSNKYIISPSEISGIIIYPQQFIVLFRSATNLALNNSGGDTLTLKDKGGDIISEINYQTRALEGASYIFINESWQWTNRPTPQETNILKKANQPPVVLFETEEIVLVNSPLELDASDSFDPNKDLMLFIWDFGNGDGLAGVITSYSYKTPGEYLIILTVSDGQEESKSQKRIQVVASEKELPLSSEQIISEKKIIISEFLPNPFGADGDGEWIELQNLSNQSVDISGWQIDDAEGGSKLYTIPDGTIIAANAWLVFEREDTKIALNNTVDKVRLFSPDKQLVDSVKYQGVTEEFSFIHTENRWQLTGQVTPGSANIFSNPFVARSSNNNAVEVGISDLNQIANGNKIRTRGIVTVKPLYFGKTYFYISDFTANDNNLVPGIQVYMYQADWPDLKVGDVIEIYGEFGITNSERRIKINNKNDIKILDTQEIPPPTIISINQITDNILGALIDIEGQIIEISGQNIYIDDGTGELRVYINQNTNINKNELKEGNFIQITGILSKTKSGFRLLPRDKNDITKTQVLAITNETIESGDNSSERDRIIKYLAVTLAALIIIAIGLTIKIRLKQKELDDFED